ncbi:DUF4139 domain-containing protein [Crocinitomix catalasitica]|uniref:DUF4139 domain-containing protein n=1 Tax=Crocinitomix catalasitica TaxID=184607 RepID=UPI00146FAC1D|nr:DUF4139 domain-containing protein [Crocinitomix catalasitica]
MKNILAFIIISLTIPFSKAANDIPTKINKVVVYQQGAQINRTGNYVAQKGITEIVVSNVSPTINSNTLQIKATGNMVILDSKIKIKYPEPTLAPDPNNIPPNIRKEIKQLQDSLFEMTFSKLELQQKIEVLNNQKRIIENNGTIKGTGKVNDSIPLLQDAINFYHLKMNTINASLLALSRTQTILLKSENRMHTRLANLNNYNANNNLTPIQNQSPIYQIVITISADAYTTGSLDISYLVNNAGWNPLYDLRSDDKANSIELTYKAEVYQNTGIDWDNVKLNLSTNNPYENKTKPNLYPWYLDYNPQIGYLDKSSMKKEKDQYEANDEMLDEIDLSKSLRSESIAAEPAIINSQNAFEFTTEVQQMISVEYAINLSYSIASDNQKNMVLIKRAELESKYMYFTVPKMDIGVYLVARITNLDALNILPGRATIFHDGSYIGATQLNPAQMNDTLDLSLGRTSNISVKRTLLKNETKEKIVGDKIEKTYAYQISVKNQNRSNIELIIQDQIPVVRDKDIEIEVLEKDKANLNLITGLLQWNEKLKAGELKDFEIKYTIKYDRTKPINLAQY